MQFSIPNCSECTYLEIKEGSDCGKFWCSNHQERHYADEEKCDRFCRAYSRNDSDVENAEKISRDYRYYILTVICKTLGMNHENLYLDSLKKLSENYLSKSKVGDDLLKAYDIIGPQVAACIENDHYKISISQTLLSNFIVPTSEHIENGNFNKATRIYIDMTKKLMKYYGIEHIEPKNVAVLDGRQYNYGSAVNH